jgi:[ribosomal protein S5]-alanine N-acetyltransferase
VTSIQTDRLSLEPLVPEHAEKLFALLSDERLYEYLDAAPPASASVLEQRYRRWSGGRSPDGIEVWLNWAARLHGTGEYVGWFQATIGADDAQIAYLVFVPYQRQGYAFEASEAIVRHITVDLQVKRVRATADPKNKASIELATALGLSVIEIGADGGDVILEATF